MKDFKQASLLIALGVFLGVVASTLKDSFRMPDFTHVTQKQFGELAAKVDEIDFHAEAILARVNKFQDCQCNHRRGVPGAAE